MRAKLGLGATRAFLFGLGVLLTTCAAHAVPAPMFKWHTLSTDWCEIHFHDQAEDAARRVTAICDDTVNPKASVGAEVRLSLLLG